MDRRLELHEILCEIVNMTEPDGDRHTYFQPPASVNMKYPCIRYSLSKISHKRANNKIYGNVNGYEVTLIDYDPESDMHDKILSRFPMCRFERAYTADNLNHKVYTIYY